METTNEEITNVTSKALIDSGLALVDIPYGQKGPTTVGWNLQQNCITDPSQSGHLQGGNIGLAHAYCTPTPTCAIDIDNYKAAKPWLASHCIELNDLLEAPDAVVIWSGKKNSRKLIYKFPAGTKPMVSTKINGPDGRVALEFRCATRDGKTVQDVLPPSIHPGGTLYQWLGNGNPLALPEIPEQLLNLWGKLLARVSRVASRKFAPETFGSQRLESPRQIAIIRDALNVISADCSYEIWRNIVWAIMSTGWTCAESIAQEWSQTTPDRYDEDAFWALVHSYMPNRDNSLTVGTIYHHARLGGWSG
jgi:putative DNA primase/helicase